MNRMNSVWFDDTPEEYTPAETAIQYIPINATVLAHLSQTTPAQVLSNAELEAAIAAVVQAAELT